ncbi:PAS domain S-box protein [Permianibacter sp. IMCC34836]|uniref:CHASE domain-containing protein n=1 Tax=Permianibacter fluminis TaxID=2738515 RepID=UPI001553278F|nr:CHASE domain-containing protein [Permianibacter fluminis]NQD36565.1 PAS domain S-box protein [Permianibacter fluminis]
MITHPGGQRWFYRRHSAWLIALASATLVLLAAWSVQQLRWRASEAQLLGSSHDLATLLAQRMRAHEQILRGAAGLFDASENVSRTDWQRYVTQLRLAEKFPGIQAVGYAERFTAAELPSHVARVRAEGFPDYQLKPPGARETYSSIIFLEPFVGRNLAAFGFDMLAEPVRAAAMQRATQTGNATLTAAVTLMQETHGEVQPGFLMYVPVYRRAAVLDNEAARAQAVVGWVYCAFRAHDLVDRILIDASTDIEFALFDGSDFNQPASLLYGSDKQAGAELPALWQRSGHYRVQQLNDFDRPWTLVTWLPADTDQQTDALLAVLLGLGSVISVLLFLLFSALSRREQQASQIAAEMSRNFRQSETALTASAQQARAIVDNVADAILSVHADGLIVQANPAAERLFGYASNALTGVQIQLLLPSLSIAQLAALLADDHAASQASNQTANQATIPATTGISTPITTAPAQDFACRRSDCASQSGCGTAVRLRQQCPDWRPDSIVAAELVDCTAGRAAGG